MIVILKGDIIASRKLINQGLWLTPLKDLLSAWGETPRSWEVIWGDFFQLEISHPEDALRKAFQIKSTIKKINVAADAGKVEAIDVRMGIGIGEKTYSSDRISESNGSAFIHAAESFDHLQKENSNLLIKSPFAELDEEINLYLKLAGLFMDKWSINSAELIDLVLRNPGITQEEMGEKLGIKQSAVSGRWKRAHAEELLAVERRYRSRIKKYFYAGNH